IEEALHCRTARAGRIEGLRVRSAGRHLDLLRVGCFSAEDAQAVESLVLDRGWWQRSDAQCGLCIEDNEPLIVAGLYRSGEQFEDVGLGGLAATLGFEAG